MNISVVIPLLNEKESLVELTDSLNDVMKSYNFSYEIIFIDDGSSDNSWDIIEELSSKSNTIKGIKFHRNYGKSQALHVGFLKSRGQVVFTMDADLQDDPKEIYKLYNMIKDNNYDLVSGWKKVRHDPWTKTLPSKIFNFFTRILTGVKIHDFNCGLKIYRKSVIKTLDIYGGRHRYIPALAGQKKFTVSEIIVNHRARKFGNTKYGGRRFFHGFFDLISVLFLSRYLQSPLYFFGQLGLLSFIAGFFICLLYTSPSPRDS